MSELTQLVKEWRRYLDRDEELPHYMVFVAMQRLDEAVSTPESREGYYPAPGVNITEPVESRRDAADDMCSEYGDEDRAAQPKTPDPNKTTPPDDPPIGRRELAAVFRKYLPDIDIYVLQRFVENVIYELDQPRSEPEGEHEDDEPSLGQQIVGSLHEFSEALEAKTSIIVNKAAYELREAKVRELVAAGYQFMGQYGPSDRYFRPVHLRFKEALDALATDAPPTGKELVSTEVLDKCERIMRLHWPEYKPTHDALRKERGNGGE